MTDGISKNRQQLEQEHQTLRAEYEAFVQKGLRLDMSRGKPCSEQLELSMPMLQICDYMGEEGIDARNYGTLEGMPEARRFFADLLGTTPEETLVCGSSSLTMMYHMAELAMRKGFCESEGWGKGQSKFLCPAPGYDRHFRITEYLGMELLLVPMHEDGPDMDLVERLVQDPAVKGIWCVPKYSNPDGYTYSDAVVRRLAAMKTAEPDFKIFWDNAYAVHHLCDEHEEVLNILDECCKAGNENRPLLFTSLSKVTFPGASVAALAASKANIEYIKANLMPAVISYDKMNQLRHVRYLKDMQGLAAHMEKHRAILAPKFEMILKRFDEAFGENSGIRWTKPKGGYFISLFTPKGCAARTVELCAKAGVTLTPAGAAFPYGKDPEDSHIRIAPSYPTLSELETAVELLCLAVKLAAAEKSLAEV